MNDWPIIISYTRQQAIDDGVLIDTTDMAKTAGIRCPVALSHAVWTTYVEFDREAPSLAGQSIDGRLWDILWMFRVAASHSDSDRDVILFRLYVAMPDGGNWQSHEAVPPADSDLTRETHRLVTLKAHIGPGDAGEPVITIMVPGED